MTGAAIWPYALIPGAVATSGAFVTALRRPPESAMSAVQHLAAGVIFYAAAGELLPDARRSGQVWPLLAGGVVGLAAMLVLRRCTKNVQGPVGLLGASAADAVIDGLALGLGSQAGRHQGLLLAVALAVEFLFLGVSIAGAFGKTANRVPVVGGTIAVSLMIPVGVAIAAPMAGWPGSYRDAAFAFGLMALLYLVTEELLVEAHEKPETVWGTALFFVGFLGLAALDQGL